MAAAAGEAAAPTSWPRSGPALPTTTTGGGPGPPFSLDVQDVDWDGYLQEVSARAGTGPGRAGPDVPQSHYRLNLTHRFNVSIKAAVAARPAISSRIAGRKWSMKSKLMAWGKGWLPTRPMSRTAMKATP